jgi:hypothetical protein
MRTLSMLAISMFTVWVVYVRMTVGVWPMRHIQKRIAEIEAERRRQP